MSITLTSSDIIFLIQIISILGYIFLGGYTLLAYKRLKNSVLLFIAFAFFIIAASITLIVTIIPNAALFPIDKEYLEAIIEGTQFLAAFFFFYGLRVIKREKEGEK